MSRYAIVGETGQGTADASWWIVAVPAWKRTAEQAVECLNELAREQPGDPKYEAPQRLLDLDPQARKESSRRGPAYRVVEVDGFWFRPGGGGR